MNLQPNKFIQATVTPLKKKKGPSCRLKKKRNLFERHSVLPSFFHCVLKSAGADLCEEAFRLHRDLVNQSNGLC